MKNRAFTLIELLLVIAIIGLLTSIIVISVTSAREKARIAAGMQFGQNIKHSIGSELAGEWSFDNDDARDDSGNGNDGIINGSTPIDGITGRAMSFNGAGNYINCGNNQILNPAEEITVEAWIKPANPGGSWQSIIANSPTGSQYNYWFYLEGNALKLSVYSATYPDLTVFNAIPAANTWYHVAFTAFNGSTKIFVNGSQIGNNGTAGVGHWPGGDTTISDLRPARNICFNGIIDEVRVYGKALSSTEIQQHYAESLNKLKLAGQ